MEQEAKITNKEWTEIINKIELTEKQTDVNEERLNRHGDRLKILEEYKVSLPHEIEKAITNSLQPVMQSIAKLVDENSKLSNKLIELENSKYKDSYNILKWVLGLVGTIVIGWIINNALS